jgi:diguanylate cyclase (GGDEF)-like protein
VLQHLVADMGIVVHPPRQRPEDLDPLLGVYNREEGARRLRRELERACRRQVPLGLLVADLDHLGRINERYGTATGDAVLARTAERMRTLLRRADILVRYGGEELMAVLPGTPLSVTRKVAERICAAVAAQPDPVPVTLSVGVTGWPECREGQLEGFLARADSAVAVAKRNGRNRVEVVH